MDSDNTKSDRWLENSENFVCLSLGAVFAKLLGFIPVVIIGSVAVLVCTFLAVFTYEKNHE